MKTFQYKAVNSAGETVIESIDGVSEVDVAQQLKDRGLHPLSIRKTFRGKIFSPRRLNVDSLFFFSYQLVSLVSGGLNLVDGLKNIRGHSRHKQLTPVVEKIIDRIQDGSSLSEAMESVEGVFPAVFIRTVRAGERTGKLVEVLSSLSDFFEEEAEFKAKRREMAMYPMILMVFVLGLIVVLSAFFLPKMNMVLSQFANELPLTSRVTMAFGEFFRTYWIWIFGAIALLVVGSKFADQNINVKRFKDRMKFKIPLMGNFRSVTVSSQFSLYLKILMGAGVTVPQAVELTKDSIDDAHICQRLEKAKEEIDSGQSLSDSIRGLREFPPLLVEMIAMGEKSGDIPLSMEKFYKIQKREMTQIVRTFNAIIEPVLLLVMGVIVLWIAMSVFLPLIRFSLELA